MPRDRRGLRGKSRRDADDRAVERAEAAREKEAADRAAEIERVDDDIADAEDDIGSLQDFRDRQAGFAPAGNYASQGHQHGADDVNSVNWSAVGTHKSPVPAFAKKSDLNKLRNWVENNFEPIKKRNR
jgi:hypothetical protein